MGMTRQGNYKRFKPDPEIFKTVLKDAKSWLEASKIIDCHPLTVKKYASALGIDTSHIDKYDGNKIIVDDFLNQKFGRLTVIGN